MCHHLLQEADTPSENGARMAEDLYFSLHEWLISHDYKPDNSYTGNSALALLCRTSYDFKVLNILLPEIEGYSVCKLYKDPGGRSRILILTGDETLKNGDNETDSPTDVSPGKPYDRQELSDKLAAVICQAPDICVMVLQIGRLKFHLYDFLTVPDETRIKLFPHEFALLAFLRTHPHIIFTNRGTINPKPAGQSTPGREALLQNSIALDQISKAITAQIPVTKISASTVSQKK